MTTASPTNFGILLDPAAVAEHITRSVAAAQLRGQAGEATRTAALLVEVGCTGAAADCQLLADDLTAQAHALHPRKDDQA